MTKGNKRKGRRRGDSSSDEDDDNKAATNEATSTSIKDLDFAQRRELKQKAAADKRRAKQVCHLCGQIGHVRRNCPGIDDGGSGASKYTKSKGDSGAISLKGSKNRGRKPSIKNPSSQQQHDVLPDLPPGFSVEHQEETADPFQYYDASCDIMATIDYIRFGRGKNKLSNKEAVALYQTAIETTSEMSNYGGCISRSLLKPGRPWNKPSVLNRQDERSIVGLGRDFLYNDTEEDAAVACLLEALSENDCIVGFFADLDYTPSVTSRPGCDRESQLRRLECTCQAAADANVTIQIHTSPGSSSASNTSSNDNEVTPYAKVMKDLKGVLTNAIAKYPLLKVHLSCWSGGADGMNTLLQDFDNVWIGFDATVSYAKASNIHECAFDVPLKKVLLETGANTIPSVVAKSMGRDAFSHSGLVPFIADALAGMKKNEDITAEVVAQAASENTLKLYPDY